MTIFIQGMCYSGKTTLGDLLSKQLNIPFFDSRDIFYNKHKVYDLNYLKQYGNEKFKQAEKESFSIDFGNSVVALSGSIVYDTELMEKIIKNHVVIWLNPTFNCICIRKKNEEFNNVVRPIVFPENINTFEDLYNSRYKLYNMYHTHVVNIDIGDSRDKIINILLSIINN